MKGREKDPLSGFNNAGEGEEEEEEEEEGKKNDKVTETKMITGETVFEERSTASRQTQWRFLVLWRGHLGEKISIM